MKVLLPQGEGVTLDLVTKKALSKEKRQEGESRNTPAPNGMISGGKKERVRGTPKCRQQLKHSSSCFHSHPRTNVTTDVFLNLTLQHTEKVLV